jgi:hypothetical protein
MGERGMIVPMAGASKFKPAGFSAIGDATPMLATIALCFYELWACMSFGLV